MTNQEEKNIKLIKLFSVLAEDRDNLKTIQSQDELPYILAHYEMHYLDKVFPVATAISIQPDQLRGKEIVDISTNVGSIPKSFISYSLVNKLNLVFNPKFVLVEGEGEWDDLLIITNKPYSWLKTGNRLDMELKTHGDVFVILQSLLEEYCKNISSRLEKLQKSFEDSENWLGVLINEYLSETIKMLPSPKDEVELVPVDKSG